MWIASLLMALQSEVSAKDVVEWMETHTKHRFVYPASNDLSKPKIRCRLQDLDPAKAYEAGLGLLKTLDLIAIRKEKAGVVELSYGPVGAKKEIPVYTAVEQLPAADEFCSLVLRPRFIDPRSAQAVLINIVGFPQNVLCIQDPPRLVLSDYASNLRRLAGLLAEVDRPRQPLSPEIAARMNAEWLVRKFLDRRFDPLPAEAAARVPALLQALGADSLAGRAGATKDLEAMGPNASPHVAPALDAKDPEVKARSLALLYKWAEEWARR